MELFLMQHGKAKPGEQDYEKSLTDTGIAESTHMALWSAAREIRVDEIWHSGKKRAAQTAAIVGEKMRPVPEIKTMQGLNPKDDVRLIVPVLEASSHNIMLVGHLPFLGRLAGLLIAGDPDQSLIGFRNSGITCLGRVEKGWEIKWVIIPDLAHQ